ncbi:acyltransferase family protein [Janthinobacterium rivuli]|uniref:acyltransferase family protein n=1 Tax=Janthinobacterium sp. FT68W TaxID=2654255 RepID=UPI0012652D2F|nr:acyltransferase [Janthinobacterium sp. FT68W]KAB8054804.1 acyltransferase family protein [Janthinobacterium sp. FT68W]
MLNLPGRLTISKLLLRGNNNFDIMRLIAALMVIVGHAYPIVGEKNLQDPLLGILHFDYSGSLAVKFFFFLSGLLVTDSLLKDSSPIKFLTRRALRVFPGLILCIFLSISIFGLILTTLPLREYLVSRETIGYFFGNITLLDIRWRPAGVLMDHQYGLNGSLWTLPVEFKFYIVLALASLFGLVQRRHLFSMALFSIVFVSFFGAAANTIFGGGEEARYLPGCFALGALAAVYKEKVLIHPYGVVCAWVIFFLAKNPVTAIPQGVLIPVFYIALFYTILWISALESVKKLRLKSDLSYGIYLYGFPVQQVVFHYFPNESVYFNQLISALLAIVFAWISWSFVESKFIALGRNAFSLKKLNGEKNPDMYGGVMHSTNLRVKFFEKCSRVSIVELFFMLVAGALIHAIALLYVYPGYYSPLLPNHTDYYMAAAMFQSPMWGFSYIGWPRPFGFMLFNASGIFGITASIAIVVFVVLLNFALTAMLFRRIFKIQMGWRYLVAYCLYVYFAYSHPYFYQFYTHDALSQFAYLVLLFGAWYWYRNAATLDRKNSAVIGITALLAFLCKENFGVAVCLLAVGIAWFEPRARLAALLVCIALILALGYNALIGSQFMGGASSSYNVVVSPASIWREWRTYMREAFGAVGGGIFLLSIFFMIFYGKVNPLARKVAILLFGAVAVLLLPNSLLPDHHYSGYSWAVSYFALLPLIYIFSLKVNWQVAGQIALGMAVLYVPMSLKKEYGRSDWVVSQEHIQRDLLTGLREYAIADYRPGRKILVTGLVFPFSPFEQPLSLQSKPYWRDTYYDVMRYAKKPMDVHDSRVKFIIDPPADLSAYSEVWTFSKDGKALGKFKEEDINKRLSVIDVKDVQKEIFLIYPQLLSIIQARSKDEPNGVVQLKIGEALLEYGNFLEAEKILKLATASVPENPYPSFFLGNALVGQKKYAEAIMYFDRAISLDVNNSNEYFKKSRDAAMVNLKNSINVVSFDK